MLYRLHTNVLIIGIMTYALVAILFPERAFNLMGLGSVVAFVLQMCLLLFIIESKHRFSSAKSLFIIVLVYSVLMGLTFMGISYYYSEDTFLFSKGDAKWYYDLSMQVAQGDFVAEMKKLLYQYAYDDWGALIFDSAIMSIAPYKITLNIVHTILSAVSAVYLFHIGKHFMEDEYAYLGALTYGTSSYITFFNFSFLKEAFFVFLVISAVYYLYRFIADGKNWSLLGFAFFIGCIMFYRPAVSALIVAPVIVYFAVLQRRNAISVLLYILTIALVLFSFKDVGSIIENNTTGDINHVINYRSNANYTGSFNYFVSFFAAFIGPFPSMYPASATAPSHTFFFAGGLIVKLFLVIPFWFGIYSAYKRQELNLLPLIGFVLLEMVATGYVCASLELRKVITHVPFMYLISYYGMMFIEKEKHSVLLPPIFYYLPIVVMLLLWNVIRV